jgi:hypothetical protein
MQTSAANKAGPYAASPISIREIEYLVHQQNFEAAGMKLFTLLEFAEQQGGILLEGQGEGEQDSITAYTRLASAITALFANPKMTLSLVGFQKLALFQKHLLGIFRLSGFRGTDHLASLIATPAGGGAQFTLQGEQQLMKFLLFYSLDSQIEIDFERFLKDVPKLAMPVYLSLLGEECMLTRTACQRRDRLLELGPLLENIPLEDQGQLSRLANLWMYCSYSESKSKHAIKAHLNVVIQKYLRKLGVQTPSLPPTRSKKDRPVILIPSEWFTSGHAMYRCFAPAIRQLKERFKLVLMSAANRMDNESKTLFDEVIEVDPANVQARKLVGQVIKVKPDMIYFPSLGMADWTLLLANLRLSPIQFMSLGHPGTSNSPFLDYVFVPESGFSPRVDCFSEKVVLLDTADYNQMIAPSGAITVTPDIRKAPSTIRLAVTSWSLKLNPSFLAVCQKIRDASPKPVEFHFFPSAMGMSYQKLKQALRDWIPDATVYESTDYNTYIANLNKCDIHLSPFPFSGTNSNVDSMQHGIPIVTLEGDEPHGRLDLPFFVMSNLPEWLWTHSEEEYLEAALRLIRNDEERVAIGQALLEQDFERNFRDHEFHHHEKALFNAVQWLYENHEAIQLDGRKVWAVKDQTQPLPD